MPHTVYTPYNIESKLFSVYYTFVELFIVFNSFQSTITVSLSHFCCVIQEVHMESSSSKQSDFLSQNTLLGEFLAERSFLDIT